MPHFPSTDLASAFLGRPLLLSLLLGVTACHRDPPPSAAAPPALQGDELARVGEVVISRSEFETERARHPATIPSEELLGRLTRREQLFAEAQATGFDRSPELQATWKALVAARFEESLAPFSEPDAPVSDAELAAHHTQHADRFTSPESVHAALILLTLSPSAPDSRRREVLNLAAGLKEAAGGGTGDPQVFSRLAREHSQHAASRRLGGDLGWLTRDQAAQFLPVSVVTQLFGLAANGGISPVLATAEGVFLIQSIERRPPQVRPLADIRERVRRDFLATRAAVAKASLRERLAARHPIAINTPLLAELNRKAPAALVSHPPRLPAR